MKCGIVGLPNVGKSTLFNALTKAGIAAENYPFCTIEPNVGVVEVPDPRLAQLAAIITPERIVPAIVEFVDIAGLVAGASTGEGLGNKFLSHIRETDATINVVRCFEDDNVIHVAGKVDPIADIEVIQTELCLADLGAVEKSILGALNAEKLVMQDPAASVVVASLQEYAVVMTVRAFVRTPDYWQALYALQKAVQIALRRDGVLLAVPRQAAVVRNEPWSPATAPPEKKAAPARQDATDGPEHGAAGPH